MNIQVIKGGVQRHGKWNQFIIDKTVVDFCLFDFFVGIDEQATITVAGKLNKNVLVAYGYIIPNKEDFMMGCDDVTKRNKAFDVLQEFFDRA